MDERRVIRSGGTPSARVAIIGDGQGIGRAVTAGEGASAGRLVSFSVEDIAFAGTRLGPAGYGVTDLVAESSRSVGVARQRATLIDTSGFSGFTSLGPCGFGCTDNYFSGSVTRARLTALLSGIPAVRSIAGGDGVAIERAL